jgi:hypothetical protein
MLQTGAANALILPLLPVPGMTPRKGALSRWLAKAAPADELHGTHTYPWYLVLWLTGVDYFSTLGYQPGIALLAAGALSPLATLLLVLVTLGGALQVYIQVAQRSFTGQGSIAMLEKLLPGWWGKLFVLILLGFASTAFVITMTISASDAAQHMVHNPLLETYLAGSQLPVTLILLILLAVVFLKGSSEAVGVGMAVGVPYILLNMVVIGRSLLEIGRHPELLSAWQWDLLRHGDWTMILVSAGLAFPKLALGLSGFETGVSVMPLVRGDPGDVGRPIGRIRASCRLLTSAAVLMSVLLLTSSFTTTLLISPADYAEGGPAAGRALAYLSHRLLGEVFGTVYDISTIAILWFAGASAIAGMLNLIPRYLPRFGMAPAWVSFNRPLVLVLLAIALLLTWIFGAHVEAQGGAYATGVLALFLSAAVAVSLALGLEARTARSRRSRRARLLSFYFWAVAGIFVYALVENVHARPDGVIIATFFILGILVVSALSRWQRATEMRVEYVTLADDSSAELWRRLCGKKVCLIPLARNTPYTLARKAKEIRAHYKIKDPLAFLHVRLLDDRSEFLGGLRMRVRLATGHRGFMDDIMNRLVESEDYFIEVEGAVALANTIAYLSELIQPTSLFLGLTRKNMLGQALSYLVFGEGETGIMVYRILVKYWEWTEDDDVRPLIFLMSE